MPRKESAKDRIMLKEMNIALGASLDAANIELEKMAKGPVSYTVSHAEFSLPVREVTINAEKNVVIAFPKTLEEMAKAQYVKVNVGAVPRVVTPEITPPKPIDVEAISESIVARLKELFARAKIKEETAKDLVGTARLIIESNLANIEELDEKAAELLAKGANIDSISKLASANIQQLHSKLKEAVNKKVVKVPKAYELKLADVERWVQSARRRL